MNEDVIEKVVTGNTIKSWTPLFIFISFIVTIIAFILIYKLGELNDSNLKLKMEALKASSTSKVSSPFDDPEVIKLADCVIKLQPKTTPFVAKFVAMNIIKESAAKKLDPDLILALIYTESEVNPNALSPKGAIGLMQVRYQTWKSAPELKDNGVDARHKLYWIDSNISCGTDILAKYLEESKGDIGAALFRYNTGDPKLTKPPWQNEYVAKILYYHYKIREHKLSGAMLEPDELAATPETQKPVPTPSKEIPSGRK